MPCSQIPFKVYLFQGQLCFSHMLLTFSTAPTPDILAPAIKTSIDSCCLKVKQELFDWHCAVLTLCNPMDCSLPDPSSVMGILQARMLEWVAMPSSRRSSQPRDRIQVSCIADRFFTSWATREVLDWHCCVSRSVVPDSLRPCGLQPTRLLCPWDFPGKDTGVGCHLVPFKN